MPNGERKRNRNQPIFHFDLICPVDLERTRGRANRQGKMIYVSVCARRQMEIGNDSSVPQCSQRSRCVRPAFGARE